MSGTLIMKRWIEQNRILIVLNSAVLLCLAIAWILYTLFGHRLVEAMYKGESIEFLNSIIEGQSIHPLAHYLQDADDIMWVISLLIIASSSVLTLLIKTLPSLIAVLELAPSFRSRCTITVLSRYTVTVLTTIFCLFSLSTSAIVFFYPRMLGIVPVLCFAIFVVTYAAVCSECGVLTRWRVSFLAAAVTWGLVVTAMTEVLSLFRLITFGWLLTLWVGAVLLSAAICGAISTREKLTALLQFPPVPRLEFWCVAAVATIASLVGLVAFAAPPNNADSMIYHMARVMHWVQNQTVAHYPTNISLQLFQPPWAEFAIMHFQVLSSGDRWANLVQWFSMVGSVIGVSLIARQLGADIRGQVLAALIAATIPMGILQASSTQNDYVEAFWLVCLAHYILRFKMQPRLANALGVGASLALALLTKGTAYIYAFPLLVWWTFLALRNLRRRVWQPLLVIGTIVLSVNMGYYARNFELWGNPLGIGQVPYSNEIFGVPVVVSNIIRNISLHMGTPSERVNTAILSGVRILHVPLGIDANDPRTTFKIICCPFRINGFSTLEDLAGNPIHLGLMMLSLALLFAWREHREARDLTPYAIALIVAFFIFCSYLKWNPWNSRLHLPLFVLWSPLISLALLRRTSYKIALSIVVLLITTSTPYVFRNEIRPLIGVGPNSTVLNTSRVDQLLMRYTGVRDQYPRASHFVETLRCSDVGLLIGEYDLEYPLWVLLPKTNRQQLRIEHINVTNSSAVKSAVNPFAGFSPCAVIVVDADRSPSWMAEKGNYTQAWAESQALLYMQAWSSRPVRVFIKRRTVEERR
jgi:Dolichyl-phosphate-mannose-protein mannosyltransferase